MDCTTALVVRLLVLKAAAELGEGDGYRNNKNAINIIVLIEIQLFFLNSCFSDFCKALVDFRAQKFDLDHLCHCSYCFYGSSIFGGSFQKCSLLLNFLNKYFKTSVLTEQKNRM